MAKFHGSFDALQQAVASIGKQGEWSEGKNGHVIFRTRLGHVLNWWASNGTLNCQGFEPEKFLPEVLSALGNPVPAATVTEAKKIFVVHGHDSEARDQLELVLLRLGLKPFILQKF